MICSSELATIYENTHATIIAYLVSKLNQDTDTAEDIYHAAITRFWKAYKRERKPLPLLVQIVKNAVYNQTIRDRKRGAHKASLPQPLDELDQLDALIQQVDYQQIHRCLLMGLKGQAFTIVKLYLDGYTKADISQLQGIPRSQVTRIIDDCIVNS